jgi:hypothetical protein
MGYDGRFPFLLSSAFLQIALFGSKMGDQAELLCNDGNGLFAGPSGALPLK